MCNINGVKTTQARLATGPVLPLLENEMKKYKARIHPRWDSEAKIREVEIEKETEKSVWINGNRSAKRSEWANYYDTWEDAHKALLFQQESYINNLRKRLEISKGVLGNIKGMRQE